MAITARAQEAQWFVGVWSGGHTAIKGKETQYLDISLHIETVAGNDFTGYFKLLMPADTSVHLDIRLTGTIHHNYLTATFKEVLYKKDPPGTKWDTRCMGCGPGNYFYSIEDGKFILTTETKGCYKSCNGIAVYSRQMDEFDAKVQASLDTLVNNQKAVAAADIPVAQPPVVVLPPVKQDTVVVTKPAPVVDTTPVVKTKVVPVDTVVTPPVVPVVKQEEPVVVKKIDPGAGTLMRPSMESLAVKKIVKPASAGSIQPSAAFAGLAGMKPEPPVVVKKIDPGVGTVMRPTMESLAVKKIVKPASAARLKPSDGLARLAKMKPQPPVVVAPKKDTVVAKVVPPVVVPKKDTVVAKVTPPVVPPEKPKKDTVVVAKVVPKVDTVKPKKDTVVIVPKPKDTVAVVKKTEPVVVPKKDTVAAVKPSQYEKRTDNMVQVYNVTTDSVTLRFYDNGVVDGDTISVFNNGQVLVSYLGLTSKAYETKIAVNKTEDNKIVFYAHNLGSFPPNTALVDIFSGKTKYSINVSSDLNVSSGIVIHFVKP